MIATDAAPSRPAREAGAPAASAAPRRAPFGRPGLDVVLISPSGTVEDVGLRQVSACLRAAGHRPRLVFLPTPVDQVYGRRPHATGYSPAVLDQLAERCATADLVGISVMANSVVRARSVTEAVHERSPAPVIWGGVHPTVRPAECLRWADMVCVGEGEAAVVELADRMARGDDPAAVAGIWRRDAAGEVVSTGPAPLCRDLDALPLPDGRLADQWVLEGDAIVPLTADRLAVLLMHNVGGTWQLAYGLAMPRGCPHACTYCCADALSGVYPDWRRVRRRSAEHVVAEIEAARAIVPELEVVAFHDDTFTAIDETALRRFAAVYRERVGLPFFACVTPESATDAKLSLLADAGCRYVEMGIQSASPRILRLYGRTMTGQSVLAAARRIHRRPLLAARYDVITDNPYETPHDRAATLDLVSRLPRPFRLNMFSLTFFPGTALHERASADGLVGDEDRDVYRKHYLHPAPTFYNLLLWGAHRNLPGRALRLLGRPWLIRLMDAPPLRWVSRLAWLPLDAVRARADARTVARRRASLTGETR